jgi:cyclopropane fatty-acyl-phospholipid synthase-like methyltransferase
MWLESQNSLGEWYMRRIDLRNKYDIGNKLYRFMLGERLIYSCRTPAV